MMNNKERIERILVWQLLHNKNFMMTSMAMSVALLLSACGGSSDGDDPASAPAPAGGKELDLLTYLDPDQPVTEDENGTTFNFQSPVKVTGSPELELGLLLDGDWVTASFAMTEQTNDNQLTFGEPYRVTYKGKVVDSLDDLPDLDNMTEVEMLQLLDTATLEMVFPRGGSIETGSLVLDANTVLTDDTLLAMLVAGDDDADADADVAEGDDADADADVAEGDDADNDLLYLTNYVASASLDAETGVSTLTLHEVVMADGQFELKTFYGEEENGAIGTEAVVFDTETNTMQIDHLSLDVVAWSTKDNAVVPDTYWEILPQIKYLQIDEGETLILATVDQEESVFIASVIYDLWV